LPHVEGAAEDTPLMKEGEKSAPGLVSPLSFGEESKDPKSSGKRKVVAIVVAAIFGILAATFVATGFKKKTSTTQPQTQKATGPYSLVECQEGEKFFDYYDFYDGPDSLGSAGYNVYVGRDRATSEGLANVTTEEGEEGGETFVYMQSRPTEKGPRDSVRLEGKRRFERGLFLLDLHHMPTGAGVWPAWWLTDEENWPDNGEIDILEGVNRQTVAKTALHTSDRCSMYAQVPPWTRTGYWDSATGIPNTYTGEPDFRTWKEADDCWNWAAHQWFNQGCVTIDSRNDTLGKPMNDNGGGVYALEWDPENRYIRSWVFPRNYGLPSNLVDAMETAGESDAEKRVAPNTTSWGVPYAYFAIGDSTGCSADHFKNMRLVFNLAFCGNVAGNRFIGDCPDEAEDFMVKHDPIRSCNAYIKSEPKELEEAYWKIKGVYVYEREMEDVKPSTSEDAQ